MLSRLRSKSAGVVTGLGDGIFAEPASHDGKASEWRPMAEAVDTVRVCAMGWASFRLVVVDKGRPAWRSRGTEERQQTGGRQWVQTTARYVVAEGCRWQCRGVAWTG